MSTKAIQLRLLQEGYSVGNAGADGIMGRDTQRGLRAFQTDRRIPVTGLADEATLLRLFGAKPTPERLRKNLPWMLEAAHHMGLQEVVGPTHSSVIQVWLKRLAAKWVDDETPWCGTFVGWCIAAGLPNEALPSNPFGARNWLKAGVPCEPTYGAIAAFSRPGSSWSGHVGFLVGQTLTHYQVRGGNQNNSVNDTLITKARFLGARWPKSVVQGPTYLPYVSGGKNSVNEA